jgi:hypothetical protein
MAESIAKINNFIQLQLRTKELQEVPLKRVAEWIDQSGYLNDSHSSPGYPLRRLASANKIIGAYRKNNYYWFIKQLNNYRELMGSMEFSKLLGYKNINSFYKKIKKKSIPHFRLENGQILFYKDEIIPWLISNQYYDSVDKIENLIFQETRFFVKEVKENI